jgi:hypothetical protein
MQWKGCIMLRKPPFQPWSKAIVEEVGLEVPHWMSARPGGPASLWPSTPQRLRRYLDKLLSAHTLSVLKPR